MMDNTKKNSPNQIATQRFFELLKNTPIGESSNVDEVRALISDGAHINSANSFGFTPLVLAAMYGNNVIVTELIACPDILVNLGNGTDKTALMMAVQFGYAEIVITLLNAKGILINKKDREGNTAFMYAAAHNQLAIISTLLPILGIEVNQANLEGETALIQAVKKDCVAAVTILLSSEKITVNQAVFKAGKYSGSDMRALLKSRKIDALQKLIPPNPTFTPSLLKTALHTPLDVSLAGIKLDSKHPRCV
jgi:ankyrin repeat protein